MDNIRLQIVTISWFLDDICVLSWQKLFHLWDEHSLSVGRRLLVSDQYRTYCASLHILVFMQLCLKFGNCALCMLNLTWYAPKTSVPSRRGICEPQQIAEKTFKNRLLIILFFTFYYAKRQQETHIRRQHKYTNTIQ